MSCQCRGRGCNLCQPEDPRDAQRRRIEDEKRRQRTLFPRTEAGRANIRRKS